MELLAHLDHDGEQVLWPVAVVAESPDDLSVVFRTYCSQWPVDGRRHVRAPDPRRRATPIPAMWSGATRRRSTPATSTRSCDTFAPDGYLREPIGPHAVHRGTAELHAFFSTCFSAGGGIGLERCAVTDDGVRCALEYNCVRWGSHDLPPQAGIAVFERGAGRTAGRGARTTTTSKRPSVG